MGKSLKRPLSHGVSVGSSQRLQDGRDVVRRGGGEGAGQGSQRASGSARFPWRSRALRCLLLAVTLQALTGDGAETSPDHVPVVERLMLSLYTPPFDWNREMTDVLVLSCILRDKQALEQMATRLVEECHTRPEEMNRLLARVTKDLWFTNRAVIRTQGRLQYLTPGVQIVRERLYDRHARWDIHFQPPEDLIRSLTHGEIETDPFYELSLGNECIDPAGPTWRRYHVTWPDDLSISLGNEMFEYPQRVALRIHDLTPLLSLNVMLQTADLESVKKVAGERDRRDAAHSVPLWQVPIHRERVRDLAEGRSRLGPWTFPSWKVRQVSVDDDRVCWASYSDAGDGKVASIGFVVSCENMQRRYLAWLRDGHSGRLDEVCAWNYDRQGRMTHYFYFARNLQGGLEGAACRILRFEKKAPDLDVFRFDPGAFRVVHDRTGPKPILIVEGRRQEIRENPQLDPMRGVSSGAARWQWVRWAMLGLAFASTAVAVWAVLRGLRRRDPAA